MPHAADDVRCAGEGINDKLDLTYFWTNTQQIEEQGLAIGFSLYEPGHLAWLAAIAVFSALVSGKYKGLDDARRRKVRRFFAIAIVLMEVYRDSVLYLTGNFRVEYLPLHLCSYAILGLLLNAFSPGQKIEKVSGQLIAYAFMPGAVSALLFCNWTEYPFLNYMCIHSFVFHGWIVCYMVMRYRAGELAPSYRGAWQSLLFLVLLGGPLFAFNRAFGTNFMFLNEASEGSPLVPLWNIFGRTFGYPGYLAAIVVLAALIFHILWLGYFLAGKGREKREKK